MRGIHRVRHHAFLVLDKVVCIVNTFADDDLATQCTTTVFSWGPPQYKDVALPVYDYKDKMTSWPSYLYKGSTKHRKTVFTLRRGPDSPGIPRRQNQKGVFPLLAELLENIYMTVRLISFLKVWYRLCTQQPEPLSLTWNNLNPTTIDIRLLIKVWDEINHRFPNYNDCTVEVWEWIGDFILHFILSVITCPCWDLS